MTPAALCDRLHSAIGKTCDDVRPYVLIAPAFALMVIGLVVQVVQ